MSVVGYARISDDDVSPDRQQVALEAAACERIYIDRATGLRARRPFLADALASLRDGDVFVVTRLDRLGGTVADLLALVADLDERGVALRSLDEGIDEIGPWGRFFFRAASALAAHERTVEAEVGLAAERRKRDARQPRRQTVSRHRLRIARDMLADEVPVRDIARHLGVSERLLRRELERDSTGGGEDRADDTRPQTFG